MPIVDNNYYDIEEVDQEDLLSSSCLDGLLVMEDDQPDFDDFAL